MPFLARHDGALASDMDLPVPRHKENPFIPTISHTRPHPLARAVLAPAALARSRSMAARAVRAVETAPTAEATAALNRSAARTRSPGAAPSCNDQPQPPQALSDRPHSDRPPICPARRPAPARPRFQRDTAKDGDSRPAGGTRPGSSRRMTVWSIPLIAL